MFCEMSKKMRGLENQLSDPFIPPSKHQKYLGVFFDQNLAYQGEDKN